MADRDDWRKARAAHAAAQRNQRGKRAAPAITGIRIPAPKGDSHMKSPIRQHHDTDGNGNPAGGHSAGRGFDIEWQSGPLAVDGVRREPNGAFVEDIIAAAIGRIEYYQASRFHSLHNAVALGHLRAAAEALAERTADREHRGVEGTHQL